MTMQYKIPLPISLWQSKQVIGPFRVLLFVMCSTCFPGLTPSIITFHHRSRLLSRSVLPAPSCSHVFRFCFCFQDSLADTHPSHSHSLPQSFASRSIVAISHGHSPTLILVTPIRSPSCSHSPSGSIVPISRGHSPTLILVTPIRSPSCSHSPSGSIVAISRGHSHSVSTRGPLKPIPRCSHYMLYESILSTLM